MFCSETAARRWIGVEEELLEEDETVGGWERPLTPVLLISSNPGRAQLLGWVLLERHGEYDE